MITNQKAFHAAIAREKGRDTDTGAGYPLSMLGLHGLHVRRYRGMHQPEMPAMGIPNREIYAAWRKGGGA